MTLRVPSLGLGLIAILPFPVEAEEELPLPTWSKEEWRDQALRAAPPLGNGILPSLGEEARAAEVLDTGALNAKYAEAPPALEIDVNAASSPHGSMLWFLPQQLDAPEQPEPSLAPTPTAQLREVAPEFVEAARQWDPRDPLIDPLQELSEAPANDLRRFLAYHAEEARIPVKVVVVGREHTLSTVASLQSLLDSERTRLQERRAALLVYPMSEPWRARLFLPPVAYQAVSSAFLSEMIDSSVAAASEHDDPVSQMREYLVQLSVRLFWMEKRLPVEYQTQSGAALEEVLSQTHANAPAGRTQWGVAEQVAGIVLISLLASLGAVAGMRWGKRFASRRRSRAHRQVWTLPEVDTTPRFGGAFCGGAGSWSHWG